MGAKRRALPCRVRKRAAGAPAEGDFATIETRACRRDGSHAAPEMRLGHFLSMCDDTGLFQHAVHCVPDRHHGYCVDDNARALLLACALNNPGETAPAGSIDGPLGRIRPACLESRHEAVSQLHELRPALARRPRLGGQSRPNALGLGRVRAQRRQPIAPALGRLACSPKHCLRWRLSLATRMGFYAARIGRLLRRHCERIACRQSPPSSAGRQVDGHAGAAGTTDWVWFEDGLAYDNARLPQALIVTGISTGCASLRRCRLAFLALAHEAADGTSRAVSGPSARIASAHKRKPPRAVRSAAFGSRCDDLGLPCSMACGRRSRMESRCCARIRMVSRQQRSVAAAGRSGDGELPRWAASRTAPNENRGGESTVSYLLSLAEIRQLARVSG